MTTILRAVRDDDNGRKRARGRGLFMTTARSLTGRMAALGVLTFGVLASPVHAQTESILLALTGVGKVCVPNLLGTCTTGLNLTGTVKLDRSGSPTSIDPTIASGPDWIVSNFFLQWTGGVNGTYVNSRVADETSFDRVAKARNNDLEAGLEIDELTVGVQSARYKESFSAPNEVESISAAFDAVFLSRSAQSTNWLTDVSFPLNAGLAFGNGAFNTLTIDRTSFTATFPPGRPTEFNYDPGSYMAYFDLTSLSPTTVVPEPSSMLLLGTGLVGVAFRLRRRR